MQCLNKISTDTVMKLEFREAFYAKTRQMTPSGRAKWRRQELSRPGQQASWGLPWHHIRPGRTHNFLL